jgi:hypothetical protein
VKLASTGGLAIAVLLSSSFAAAQPPPEEDDVEVPAQPTAPPPASAPPAAAPPAAATKTASDGSEVAALRRELAEMQARLNSRIQDLERRAGEGGDTKAAAGKGTSGSDAAAPKPGASAGTSWLDSLVSAGDYLISGYIQAQYENHQDSQDQLLQGGQPLNQDRFLVRRGRLRLDVAYRYTELALEIDGSTTRGPFFGVRRAEASLVYRSKPWDGKVVPREQRDAEIPYAMLTFGLTEVPFGFELTDSSRNRVFMERSQASLAFFPGEPDVGVRLSGGVGVFRYAVAVMNGEPLDDRSNVSGRDPNSGKDVVARVGVDTRPAETVRVSGGVSALYGVGFHRGTDATKGAVQWRDLNENSAIDPGEITALPGSAATPSENFDRWALGVDLQLRFKTPLGTTFVYGEAGVAQNMDRGLFVADPIQTGIDARHLFYYGAIVQEVTRWGLAGFRVDAYDPNADFLDNRTGRLLPVSQTITTLSPLVGLTIPGTARLVFQYDVVFDALSRNELGVPADLKNDRFTLRLQVEK